VLAVLASPQERILGLELAHGGHLAHGMKLNFSGKLYEAHAYGVDPQTHRIETEAVRAKAREIQQTVLIAGWSALSAPARFAAFRAIACRQGS
jgi:glycine hydroxymethyltransferase